MNLLIIVMVPAGQVVLVRDIPLPLSPSTSQGLERGMISQVKLSG